jgi:hypothetical protein
MLRENDGRAGERANPHRGVKVHQAPCRRAQGKVFCEVASARHLDAACARLLIARYQKTGIPVFMTYRPNVKMSVPSNLKMSVSPAF